MRATPQALPFLGALSLPAWAAESAVVPPPPVETVRFAGNRAAAVSYTFDDGTLGHYTVAAPALERFGFRGTFGVIVRKAAAHLGPGGAAIPAVVSGDRVLVNVVPGSGDVTVRWTHATGHVSSTRP